MHHPYLVFFPFYTIPICLPLLITILLFSFLFFHSLDPTLNLTNILRVTGTHCIPLWGSKDSFYYLDMPESQYNEIAGKLDDEEQKKQLITSWLANHPCPTWEHVTRLLRGRFGIGSEGEKAAIEVDEKYLKSKLLLLSIMYIIYNIYIKLYVTIHAKKRYKSAKYKWRY